MAKTRMGRLSFSTALLAQQKCTELFHAFTVVAKPGDQPKWHSNLSQHRARSLERIIPMAVERNRIAARHRDDDQTTVFGRIYSVERRTAIGQQEGCCGTGGE